MESSGAVRVLRLAELLIQKKATTLMEEFLDAEDDGLIPNDILLLVKTKHVFEIKSQTYYNHGQYESFTVNKMIEMPAATKIPDKKEPTKGSVVTTLTKPKAPKDGIQSSSSFETDSNVEDT